MVYCRRSNIGDNIDCRNSNLYANLVVWTHFGSYIFVYIGSSVRVIDFDLAEFYLSRRPSTDIMP